MGALVHSWSKLEAFETCPKKYYEYSVARSIKDDDRSALEWGNEVHDMFRDALKQGRALPETMLPFEHWVQRVRDAPGELFVEQKYGLTRDLSPCPYFSPVVWYRGIADAVKINDDVALAIDWKTGKKKEGSDQLGLMALCVFQHFSKVKAVRTEFVWLQSDEHTTQVFKRPMHDFIMEIMPRFQKLEWAHAHQDFPPTPGGLCKRYCKVVSCPFHGKGAYG